MTINPKSPVATLTTKRASTIPPQAIVGARLFQTIATLVAIAVSASVRWSTHGNGEYADRKTEGGEQPADE